MNHAADRIVFTPAQPSRPASPSLLTLAKKRQLHGNWEEKFQDRSLAAPGRQFHFEKITSSPQKDSDNSSAPRVTPALRMHYVQLRGSRPWQGRLAGVT
jgi:hypothetical protein